ncbi:MAG: leucine-rich repeat protein [Lachnospiraceae bacterium]|nr:leucine-rich repeat protein [Lachnospiraceae bacterium]
MRKHIRILLVVFLISLLFVLPTHATSSSTGVLITGNIYDERVIPDKYNTGCTGNLTKVQFNQTINNVLIIPASNNTRFVLDFYYRNKNIAGTVCIENYDFSDYSLWSYNEDKVERNIHIIFRNCKFSSVATGKGAGKVSFTFDHCTMNSFNGSNATMNRCQFGNSYSDGLVPFQNVRVNDSFFTDMASIAASGKEIHTDGTQIYGIKDIDVSNVHYNNCRFEVPPVCPLGSTAYVNACIMLQLEYSNANNMSFTNCIVNGGGYSIYARGKGEGFTFDNVKFDNIRFGCAMKYGVFYTDIHPDIDIKNIGATDSLYIGSVWKDDGKTHLSVTNDTNQERTLVVYTENGAHTYTIPACTKGSELTSDVTYNKLPFDQDVVINEDCQYVVCYDHTLEGCAKQIRFMNWSETDVYIADTTIKKLTNGAEDILISGSCGKNVTYTLTKSGVLTLSGTGNTDNFHSTKFPGWIAYVDYIKEIRVEEGIVGLGSMIFRNCYSVQKVILPNSLKTIGQRAFGGCVSLKSLTIPANVIEIGNAVFSGLVLQEIYYDGENWENVQQGTGNEQLETKVVYYENGSIKYRIIYILNDSDVEKASHNNPVSYVPGEELMLEKATRPGYVFLGWYMDEELTKRVDSITKDSSSNIKLYAKWEQEPVIFKKNTVTVVMGKKINNIKSIPVNATSTSYVSNNKKVATVDRKGVVKGIKPGKALITATTNGVKSSFVVYVSPKKITGVKATSLNNKTVRITWKKDKKASGYQIVMKTGTKGKYKSIKTIKKNKTVRFTKKRLKKGKKYYFKVRAYKSVDGRKIYGPYSKVKKITIK